MSDLRTAAWMALDALLLEATEPPIPETAAAIDALRAALAADPKPVANDLHAQIMNIPTPCGPDMPIVVRANWNGYVLGHRDARHAAAEIALAYTADPEANEIDRLRDLNRQLVDKANGYVIHNARLNDENQRLRAELAATTAHPLTDEQIAEATGSRRDTTSWLIVEGIARAIERAHGIGGTHG